MLMPPTEMERLTVINAAELARKRRAKGLKLNYPEATALICDEILEGAREGRSVADLIGFGSTILTTDNVMPGVAEVMPMIQVEATFPDGTKLVAIHDPIRPGEKALPAGTVVPGEIVTPEGEIELNAGRQKTVVTALNTGDRPIQVGSHFHFFEINKAMDFDRSAAFGKRLDIPSGTAVRFEPGQSKEVVLVTFGGTQTLGGLNNLTETMPIDDKSRDIALKKARALGFKGA